MTDGVAAASAAPAGDSGSAMSGGFDSGSASSFDSALDSSLSSGALGSLDSSTLTGGTNLSSDLFSPEPLSTVAPSFGSTSLDPLDTIGASSLSSNLLGASTPSLFDPTPLSTVAPLSLSSPSFDEMSLPDPFSPLSNPLGLSTPSPFSTPSLFDPAPMNPGIATGFSSPFDFSSTQPGAFTTLSSAFGPAPVVAPPTEATPTEVTPTETPNLFDRIGDRFSTNFDRMFSTPLGPGQEYRDLVAPFTQPNGTWTDSLTAPFRTFNDALFNGVPALADGAARTVGATYHSLVDAGVEGAVSLGMERNSAERLGRDIHAMPEAFAGMAGAFAPMRAGVVAPGAAAPRAYNISTTGMTAAERQAVIEYAQRSNAWLAENGPVTVQPTAGTLRSQASAAARTERLNAERAGTPYQGQAGHVPDTALTGLPNPPAGWLDMPGTSNNVAGGGLSSRIGQRVDVITIDGSAP